MWKRIFCPGRASTPRRKKGFPGLGGWSFSSPVSSRLAFRQVPPIQMSRNSAVEWMVWLERSSRPQKLFPLPPSHSHPGSFQPTRQGGCSSDKQLFQVSGIQRNQPPTLSINGNKRTPSFDRLEPSIHGKSSLVIMSQIQ